MNDEAGTTESFESEFVGDALVVRLREQFLVFPDQFTPIEDGIAALRSERSIKTIIVNCQQVEHLSSSSLGKMFGLDKRLKGEGCTLRLCHLNEHLKDLMHVTQLETVIDIRDTEAEALEND
jgi:anti-anti-sigma factor